MSPSKRKKPPVEPAEVDPTVYRISHTKSHTVYRTADGKRVPGVTTVLGVIAKPHLLRWAWQCGMDGNDYNAVRDEAASIGTIAHAMVEAHLRGMTLDTSNLNPEYVNRAETSFIKFLSWWDAEGFQTVKTELALVSEMYRVGGTLDILAHDMQGRLVLIDLKTSKGIYDEYKSQTSAYAALYEEIHKITVDRVFIARIGKDEVGDFEVQEVHDRESHFGVFTAALNLYRARQQAKHR